jgi:hypothetical protein
MKTEQEKHGLLDHDEKKVWCTVCGKIVEERDSLPDYFIFMGGVWAGQNLPCSPDVCPSHIHVK